ncbi:MAG: methionyl-tRNA formyltransferase [Dehalococcoidales bacterium]|nr:methionyl-tRNA formyltransferase [Dehalococcoidales bacterium]
MGSPGFAVLPLEYLVQDGYEVAAVYTQPDRPAGRGRQLILSPVKQAAQRLGIKIVQPEKLRSPEVVAELAGLQPEAIIVAAYGQILPKAVLDIPELGCINIHPSLLPRHRGASPVLATLLAGDEFAGVTIMLLNEGLDTGPVLSRAQIPVAGVDTTGTLTEKLSLIGACMVTEVLPHLVRGEIQPRSQDDKAATYSAQVAKEEGEINWHLSAAEIGRHVRAFQPWPGAYTIWQGKRLEIQMGFPLPGGAAQEPGTVMDLRHANTPAAFGVATGEGMFAVTTVQLAGKKAMSAAEFLRGQPSIIGAELPSVQ